MADNKDNKQYKYRQEIQQVSPKFHLLHRYISFFTNPRTTLSFLLDLLHLRGWVEDPGIIRFTPTNGV